MSDLANLDATAQAELVRSGEAQPIELVDAAIARIEALNDDLNAVIHPLFERARAAANGTMPDGPFRGVPILVKDLDGTLAGAPYHGGNKLLKALHYTPATTSHMFTKLEAAGCVIVGKTNTPELGLMTTTEPQAYGPTRNPWDTTRTPGGSSGGSAAAVASGMVPFAHAGDGGGSIRVPSSMCGLFGLKPSRGRISLGPDESDPWSGFVMRHVVARSVRDSATALDVLQGYMTGDPVTAPPPARPYASEVAADPGKLRVGVCTTVPAGLADTDPVCAAAATDAAELLESLGHIVEAAAPPALAEADLMQNFSTVLTSWVRADLMELEEIAGRPLTADDVEPMTWLYHQMGTAFDGGAFVTSLNALQSWTRRVVSWWLADGFDLLLTPTCAEPPPLLGDIGGQDDGGGNSAARSIPFAAYPAPFNVTGQPAMSVPLYWSETNLPIGVQPAAAPFRTEESRRATPAAAGRSEANPTMSSGGLPIGVQLVGAPFREDVLFRVAAQLEAARPWAERRPPVHA